MIFVCTFLEGPKYIYSIRLSNGFLENYASKVLKRDICPCSLFLAFFFLYISSEIISPPFYRDMSSYFHALMVPCGSMSHHFFVTVFFRSPQVDDDLLGFSIG